MTGFLIMAVREARRCRESLAQGDVWPAIDRLCWAWRYLGKAEAEPWAIRSTPGWRRSYARAWAAVDIVRTELARACRMTLVMPESYTTVPCRE